LQEIKTQGLDCKTSKCQGSKRKWPLTSALFIFFTRKQEENGCLYCIKIHATAWHSLVIKTREGEPVRGGGEEKKKNCRSSVSSQGNRGGHGERPRAVEEESSQSSITFLFFFCCQRGVNTGNQQDARTGELGGESEPPGEREREREKEANETNQKKTQETEQTEGKQRDREEKNKNVLTGGLGKRKTQETESVSTISSPSSATLRPLGIQTGEEPPSLLFRPPSSSTIVFIFL